MADIQRIIIEIAADVTELQPAVDQLEKLGEIDKKTADAFKKTNAEISARAKTLQGVTSEQSKVTESTKQTQAAYEKLSKGITDASKNLLSGASKDLIEGFADGVNDALKEAGVSAQQFEAALEDAFKNGAKDAPQATERVVSLKTQLRQMKEELATLDPNSSRFKELSQQAGELQDKIGDVALEVRNLASDTRNIDGVVQGVQGLAGAFQLAEGSAALFGNQSEEIQQTLVRLTALMNISNGLQQVGNLLQRQSAAVLLVTNAQQKIGVALKALEGATESKNIIIRSAAIVSQKALNAVMAANPAGLLVVALGALAGALVYFSSTTEDATEKQTKLNESQLEGLKLQQALAGAFEKQSDKRVQILEDELVLLRARGATGVEIAKKELEIANAKAAQFKQTEAFYRAELQGVENLREEYNNLSIALQVKKDAGADEKIIANLESELQLVGERLKLEEDLQKKRRDAASGKQVAGANLEKAQAEEAKKALEDLQKKREEAAKRFRELELQALEDKKATIEAELTVVEEGTVQELELKTALIQAQAQIDLFSLEGTKNTEAQRNLIVANATKENKDIRVKAELDAQKAVFEAQNKIGSTDTNLLEAELSKAQSGSLAELQIKQDLVEAKADLDKLAAQEKFATSKKTVEDEKLFASEIVAIDAEEYSQKLKNREDYDKTLAELDAERLKAEQELQQAVLDATIEVIQAASDAYFAQQREDVQNNLQIKLNALNAEKNAELNNKRLTAAQKEAIEEKYRKREAALKLAAWESQQDAAESQALINAALGITQALASTPPPYSYVLAAAVAALAAIQIDAIRSATPPQFFTGTEYLERGKNPIGRDTIPVMAHEGERIVPTQNNQKYYESYSILQNEKVTPEYALKALQGPEISVSAHPQVTPEMMDRSITVFSPSSIDYGKLGKSVAGELMDGFDDVANQVIKTGSVNAELLSIIAEKVDLKSLPFNAMRKL